MGISAAPDFRSGVTGRVSAPCRQPPHGIELPDTQ
jgi:hypothetical protein